MAKCEQPDRLVRELFERPTYFCILNHIFKIGHGSQIAKYGNKHGKKLRLFKRAPIHDAFRIKPGQLSDDLHIIFNWPRGCWLESKITTRFWIVTIGMATLAIITLKIR